MVILRGQIAFQEYFVCVLSIACSCTYDHRKINTRQQTLDYSFETHRMSYQKGWSSPVHTYDTTRYATQIALYARNVCEKLNMALRDMRNALG